jgi:hypothetical protein
VQADPAMTHGEDAVMQGHELAGSHPLPDQIPTETQLDQLPPGDDAVLSLSQLADGSSRNLPWCNAKNTYFVSFALHQGGGWRGLRHGLDAGRGRRAGGALGVADCARLWDGE